MLDLKALLTKLIQNCNTRTLLWTNPQPTASFSAKNISLPNVYYKYDFIEVEYLADNTQNTTSGMKYLDRTPCCANSVATILMYSNSNYWELWHRARWWTQNDEIHFDTCYYNVLTNNATGSWDGNMVPYKIYGIKIGGGNNLLAFITKFFKKEVI